MLLELTITNFALIDKVQLVLHKGLNILTGETGAGKSIIIDAVGFLLGGRARVEFIRAGAEKATVQGLFSIQGNGEILQVLEEKGLGDPNEDILLLSREFSRMGKGICRINGQAVPLVLYKELGARLIDLHGQHDHQSLLLPEKHLALLDSFGQENFWRLRHQLAETYEQWATVKGNLRLLYLDEKEKARKTDLLTFQIKEIDQVNPVPGEDEILEQERLKLQNSEKLAGLTARAYAALFANERGEAAIDLLQQARRCLEEIAEIDDGVGPMLGNLENAYYQIEDLVHNLRNYREDIEFNPGRLNEIEARLYLIRKLKRKYGETIENILAYREQMTAELDDLVSCEKKQLELDEMLAKYATEYEKLAQRITDERRKMARKLQEAIKEELTYLNMPKTSLVISHRIKENYGPDGRDEMEFLLSANPGEPLRPLAKIASGGEMSRIMLALKTVLAKVDRIPTLIFDEIDTGIGGRALQAVAEKLAEVAQGCQVICVTHAPQIASFAAAHFVVGKQMREGRTITFINQLEKEERVEELARMLGGAEITPTTLRHAREMLAMAAQKSAS